MVYYFVKTNLEHRHINLDLATVKCCSEIFEVTDLKKIARKISFVKAWMIIQVTDFMKTCYIRSHHYMKKALFLAETLF